MVDMKTLHDKFRQEYKFLYDHSNMAAGYSEALQAFDYTIKLESFRKLVDDFNAYRQDFISSDREASAFMFACESLGILEELGV